MAPTPAAPSHSATPSAPGAPAPAQAAPPPGAVAPTADAAEAGAPGRAPSLPLPAGALPPKQAVAPAPIPTGPPGTGNAPPAAGANTNANAAGSPAGDGAAAADPVAADASRDPSLDALATSDIALIDEELAEHQRWGAAAARVGDAGSSTRARFLAREADAGVLGGGAQAFATGAGMGAATRALEIAGERVAIRLAGKAAARSAPIPAIGAVIGGVMSAMDLADRDWGKTGQTIGRFGQGASDYDMLANSIAAISEILSVYTSVLNVIAGVIGAISIAMWVITVVTVGVATPLAATLSTIALAIGTATMILDAINALVLQPLITSFRALHAFKSQADPTEVEEQGGQVRQAAAAGAGFVGGFAGGLAGSHGAGAAGRRMGLVPHEAPAGTRQPQEPPPAHETPPPAAGDGPTITAERAPEGAPGAPGAAEPQSARAAAGETVPAPETQPARAPGAEEFHMADDQAPARPEAAGAKTAAPEQLSFGPDFTNPPTPVAPSNPRSAALRALAAEAAGEPRPAVNWGTDNVGRHLLPDATFNTPGGMRTSRTTASPTPDLYQPSPRPGPRGSAREHQSHHPELQSLLRDRVEGGQRRGIADYNPNEDITGLLRQQGHHDAISAGQRPQYLPDSAALATERGLGRPESLQAAHNLLVWGDANGPTSPNARPLMDPAVAGQLVYEHANYLFETTRPSADFNGPAPTRPGERPLAGRRTADEVMRGLGGPDDYVEGHAAYDWDRTFGLDPAAQPPGTQLGMFGEHTPPPPAASPQLALPLPEPAPRPQVDARQGELFAPRAAPSDAHAPLAMADTAAAPGPAAARPQKRSDRPLSAPERTQMLGMAAQMGYPPERVVFHDGPTSVRHILHVGPSANPLPHERAQAMQMAAARGYPPDQVVFHNGPTESRPILHIGPDINPLAPGQRPTGLANPANVAIEPRGVLGHEIIGHVEAAQAGQRQPTRAREEFQASTRAALHTPELPPDQMRLLMDDARARLRNEPADTGTFYIYTDRPGAAVPAPPQARPANQFRPQDQLPKVVVDWQALGARPPEGAPAQAPRPPIPAPERAPAPLPGLPPRPGAGGTQAFADGAGAAPAGARAPGGDFRAAFDRMRHGYVGTVAGGLWHAVPGVEQAQRLGRIGSGWFGDERLRPPPSRRDATGQAIPYSAAERRAMSVGGGVGMVLGGVAGGPVGAYLGARVGEGVTRRGADFVEGVTRGATEPIVERVSPAYPAPPPGGYDQLNALQERLARILEARAQAEAAKQSARRDAQHHQANAAPLNRFDQRTQQSISATQAHQAATQRRKQANTQREEREADVSAKLADAQQRKTGLSVLTVPMRAFRRFSSLGDSMPDGIPMYPAALVGPKRKIRKLNQDSTDFLNAMNGVDSTIGDQQTQSGPRRAEATQNGRRLDAAKSEATAAQDSLQDTRKDGQALARTNQQRTDESRQDAASAAAQGANLDGEAQRTQGQMSTASQQWQAWAQAHRQARLRALAEHRKALEARGYRIRDVSER
ncbi:MAG: hypothetical protein KF778_04010 [Rhodocyclaceae bacterium]|nr:hypothetical protein [Rhodocyclaceae bacterium]MBX3667545.1 hypothetical protein [Rhodocyclaceae bacterium]